MLLQIRCLLKSPAVTLEEFIKFSIKKKNNVKLERIFWKSKLNPMLKMFKNNKNKKQNKLLNKKSPNKDNNKVIMIVKF